MAKHHPLSTLWWLHHPAVRCLSPNLVHQLWDVIAAGTNKTALEVSFTSLAGSLADRGGVRGDHQAQSNSTPPSLEQLGRWSVCVCPWAPAVRRPLSPGPDISPARPAASPSVSHTLHAADPSPGRAVRHFAQPVPPSLLLTHTLAVHRYAPSGRPSPASRRLCGMAGSMAVAAGHVKSSVLPLIVLITSLGAASLLTYWPPLLLWNSALLTWHWWCHRASGCAMGSSQQTVAAATTSSHPFGKWEKCNKWQGELCKGRFTLSSLLS